VDSSPEVRLENGGRLVLNTNDALPHPLLIYDGGKPNRVDCYLDPPALDKLIAVLTDERKRRATR
jgi:hypothetical protein